MYCIYLHNLNINFKMVLDCFFTKIVRLTATGIIRVTYNVM